MKAQNKVGLQGRPAGEEHPERCGYPLLSVPRLERKKTKAEAKNKVF